MDVMYSVISVPAQQLKAVQKMAAGPMKAHRMLEGVHIEPHDGWVRLVATDTFRLGVADVTWAGHAGTDPVTVDCREVARAVKSKARAVLIDLEAETADVVGACGEVLASGVHVTVLEAPGQERGRFPDYGQLLPGRHEDNAGFGGAVSAELMAEGLRFVASAVGRKSARVGVFSQGDLKPVVLSAYGEDGSRDGDTTEAVCLVMPMRGVGAPYRMREE